MKITWSCSVCISMTLCILFYLLNRISTLETEVEENKREKQALEVRVTELQKRR